MMLRVLCFCFNLRLEAKPSQNFLVGFWVDQTNVTVELSFDVHLFSVHGFLQDNAIFSRNGGD